MKFLVLRQRDERSSSLCKRIERIAYSNGGLEFPFTLDGIFYSQEDAVEHVQRSDSSYYTHLFHENCRCHLIPLSEENSSTLGEIDEVDEQYMMHGTAGYTGMLDFEDEFDTEFTDTMYEMYADFYGNL